MRVIDVDQNLEPHVHNFGQGDGTVLWRDCACGRCPAGVCDGTGIPVGGFDEPPTQGLIVVVLR